MSTEELEDQLDTLRKKLFELRSQAVTETLENNKTIRNTKHDVARIKTILCERKTVK
jgi:large subunit ribosomal protein L29